MSVPVLVTPATAEVVGVSDLKAFLRVDHGDEDGLIGALADAATAWLDGWGGVLGRAIMPQTWRQDFEGPGPHVLAMPDVVTVAATVDDVAVDVIIEAIGAGAAVTAEGVTGTLRVTYTCQMPPERLPAAQAAVKMLVAHWYMNRETVVTGTIATDVPMTVGALVAALRWRFV
ncbi:head-tail connector protein [Gemmobacter nectariphilus]|uniref:head-tail connector protein n=1 Tax=Gemmobacter nectariphilus TaxID=220343 RepID=UPI0004221EE2|nr:head-tail connector protein [Gemmobacter nectariphilus]